MSNGMRAGYHHVQAEDGAAPLFILKLIDWSRFALSEDRRAISRAFCWQATGRIRREIELFWAVADARNSD